MIKQTIKMLALAAAVTTAALPSWAATYVQQFGYEAPDGDRITGFVYQTRETAKDAPLAVLMHGLMGSSLYWLAEDNAMNGDDVTAVLMARGYRVVALDARGHGARDKGIRPIEHVMAARKGDSAAYEAMITATIKDYQVMLDKMLTKYPETSSVLVAGYSMGAQMGTILTASDDRVTRLITMVPPAVRNVPAVSPYRFAPKVTVPWLLLMADRDQYSTPEQYSDLIAAAGRKPETRSFDSQHVLPDQYVAAIEEWLEADAR